MTDALAFWFLKTFEDGNDPHSILQEVCREGRFEEWISGLRERRELRNDDVTYLELSFNP